MDRSVMMLVNPAAGRAMSNVALGSAVSAFCSEGYTVSVYYTTGPGAAQTLVREHASRYPRLVCLGGDGTLSDTIAGLMTLPAEERPRLGYIPMGTANDVANTLGLPMRQPARAAKQILDGTPLPYDVGEMLGVGYFTYIAAFGAFTQVSYQTDQELKHALGHAAYILEGIASLPTIKSVHCRVEYDGGELEDEFLYGAVSNSLSVAGMVKMDPALVDLSDGQFELLLVKKPANPGDLNTIVTSILNRSYDSPCLRVVHTSHVKFTFDAPVPWTRDGEDGGGHTELELHCHPRGVEIWR